MRLATLSVVLLALASEPGVLARKPAPELPSARLPAAARVVAIGDLHGDLDATRRALRLAGATDAKDRWIGGGLVVVQTGDQTDRGDDEPEILALLDRLETEATAAGGRLIVLNGNHELMNAAGDFRYVTPDGLNDYGGEDGRRRAFAPGSPLARGFARRPIYAIVGDSLFVHAGVLPAHLAAGLENLDAEARAWLRGESAALPRALVDRDSPLWTRAYGLVADETACAKVRKVLRRLALARMVVAHTTNREGATSVCGGRLWRIDVGLAQRYGGPLELLEIVKGSARVLRAR